MDTEMNTTRVKITWRIERLPASRFLMFMTMIVMLGYFFENIDAGAIGYLLPAFAAEFEISNATLGSVGTMSNIGVMIGALSSGLLSDKIGRKKIIVGAMFWWGICGLILANARSLEVLIIARILLGVGLGAQLPATITFLAELVPARMRAVYITAASTSIPIGNALAGLISYSLMPQIGWRGVAIIEALPCLAALLILKFVPESPRWLESKGRYEQADAIMEEIETSVEKSIGGPLPEVQIPPNANQSSVKIVNARLRELFSKKYIKTTIMISLWWPASLAANIGLTTWFTTLLVASGFTSTKSIGYVTIMSLGGLAGIPVVRFLAEKIGRKWATVTIGVSAGVTAFLYGHANVLPLIIGLGLLYNVFSYSAGMISLIYTPELYPTGIRGTAMGYSSFIGRIGAILGPIVIGLIMQGYSVQAVFYFGAAMFFLYSIVILLLGPETRGKIFTD